MPVVVFVALKWQKNKCFLRCQSNNNLSLETAGESEKCGTEEAGDKRDGI